MVSRSDGYPCPSCGSTEYLPNTVAEANPWWAKVVGWLTFFDPTSLLLLPLALFSGKVRRNIFCVRCSACGALVRKRWRIHSDVWSD